MSKQARPASAVRHDLIIRIYLSSLGPSDWYWEEVHSRTRLEGLWYCEPRKGVLGVGTALPPPINVLRTKRIVQGGSNHEATTTTISKEPDRLRKGAMTTSPIRPNASRHVHPGASDVTDLVLELLKLLLDCVVLRRHLLVLLLPLVAVGLEGLDFPLEVAGLDIGLSKPAIGEGERRLANGLPYNAQRDPGTVPGSGLTSR